MSLKKPPSQVIRRAVRLFKKHGSNAKGATAMRVPVTTFRNYLRYAKSGVSRETDAAGSEKTLKENREAWVAEFAGMLRERPTMPYQEYIVRKRGSSAQAWRAVFGSWNEFKRAALSRAFSEEKLVSKRGLVMPQSAMRGREEQRFSDELTDLRGKVRSLMRELNRAEDLRQAVFDLKEQPLVPPEWILRPQKASGGPGIPLLLFSDAQWGEVIKASELDGINEYNKAVASRRYRTLIEKTVELCSQHMVNPRYDGMIYMRGGDMISGEIHADLRETNDLQAVPAVKDIVEHECAGIEQLLKSFGRVHIVSVPGNHGRLTIKPQSKGYAERNLDTLSAWWLESYWKKERRVTFQTPVSGDAIIPVYGFKFLLTHGDRIGSRGGEGFIGAVATITRGMKKTADFYAALGQNLDVLFIGHFHVSLELEYGFANGSLPGYSQFARDLRMRPQPPKQWLLFCHPRYGITARWPVLLEPRPALGSFKREDHVFGQP